MEDCMSETATRRFVVIGKVQGVFFRASTRDCAVQLGIKGYAKNLHDGSVEVVATGPMAAVELLEKWLWQGPPTASVTAVHTEAVAEEDVRSCTSFVTL